MAMIYYPAIMTQNAAGWVVTFPDFDDLLVTCETPADLTDVAAASLTKYLAALIEEGKDLPDPSRIEDAFKKAKSVGGAAMIVTPRLPTGKKVRILVEFDAGTVQAIDDVSKNRSAFIRDAVNEKLGPAFL